MTENEAIKYLEQHGYIADDVKDVAIKALEEIQQYRAIGTVEEINETLGFVYKMFEDTRIVLRYLNGRFKAYKAIGTVEECQQAMERMKPKKVKQSGVTDNKGKFHPINGINGVPYDLCPNCEINLCTDGVLGRNKKNMKYCENCGQRLDWSEGE